MSEREDRAAKAAIEKAAATLTAAGWLVLSPDNMDPLDGPGLYSEWSDLVYDYPPYIRPPDWSDLPRTAQLVWRDLALLAANR